MVSWWLSLSNGSICNWGILEFVPLCNAAASTPVRLGSLQFCQHHILACSCARTGRCSVAVCCAERGLSHLHQPLMVHQLGLTETIGVVAAAAGAIGCLSLGFVPKNGIDPPSRPGPHLHTRCKLRSTHTGELTDAATVHAISPYVHLACSCVMRGQASHASYHTPGCGCGETCFWLQLNGISTLWHTDVSA